MPKNGLMLVLVFLFPARDSAQTHAQVDSFYSPSLRSMACYSVLLPDHYDSRRLYPVLYLLHGYGGNHLNWTELTDLPSYAGRLGMIIIMPFASNSWYVNSFSRPRIATKTW